MIVIFSSTEFYIDHILPGVQGHDPNYSANLKLHVERFRTVYKNEGVVPRFVEYCLPKLEGPRSAYLKIVGELTPYTGANMSRLRFRVVDPYFTYNLHDPAHLQSTALTSPDGDGDGPTPSLIQ